jgi:RNA polymerase sigma-70 factor (ECF subfamily)
MSPDSLADRVKAGDPSALADFLEERRPALRAFVVRRLGAVLKGKVEPDDVLQELAVKALRDLPQVGQMKDPFSWLCHLAEQCIVDGHRRFAADKRKATREIPGNVRVGEASQDLVALLTASFTTPSQAVIRDERQRRLQEAIARMSEEQRDALRFRYVEGLSTKEVADRLKKTDVATRVLLSRLIQKLQELLGPGEASQEKPEATL